jgi:hypothetical protein
MNAFRLSREAGSETIGKKLMAAELTAKTEHFPVVFVVERDGFIHDGFQINSNDLLS